MRKQPIHVDHDHEDYFTMEYRCPSCDAHLCQYSYGRSWCEESKKRMLRVRPDKCPKCGQKIDWRAEDGGSGHENR